MTQPKLLVSVASEDEVEATVKGGADIVDIKNPLEGSLGANFPSVIRQVRELTPDHIPVSAAIGDAPNLPGTLALAGLGAALCGVQYVKVGLLGPNTHKDAVFLLTKVCEAVREQDPNIQMIATAYADGEQVGALPPMMLPTVASEAGVDGCLLDTAAKGQGNLLTHLNPAQLRDFVGECHQAQLLCALAGSLTGDILPEVLELGADIIGVRTAACRGGRNGKVNRQKVQEIKTLMDTHTFGNGRTLAGTVESLSSTPS